MPGLAFAPAMGHLQAGAEVAVAATFQSDMRAQLAGAAVALKLSQITYKAASLPPAWLASAAAGLLPAPAAEPEHTVVPKSEKELAIKARCMPKRETHMRISCQCPPLDDWRSGAWIAHWGLCP